jgi:thiol-disulfide isomerase/thioredoxin
MAVITFSRGTRRGALMLLLALALGTGMASAGEAPAVGQAAPALIARLFDGQVLDLASLRGKVVVLNFWASWCVPCRDEMPLLDALGREFRDQGLVVVGLSADDRHDRADALKSARKLGYALGLLSEATRNEFGVPRTLPLTYIIDREGVIRTVLSANRGAISAAALREAVVALLSGTQS